MIKINLLPYREKAAKAGMARQIILTAGILIFLVVIMAGTQIYLSANNARMEGEIKAAEEKLVVLDKKVGDVEKFKENKRVLERKLSVINGLEENRLAPVKMLDELVRLVPTRDVWLDKFTQKGADLQIEGVARDNTAVSRLMWSLERASFISGVELVSTKEKEVSKVKLQQFILNCRMKKGA
jgi:type IV pilus assembly protein PilN